MLSLSETFMEKIIGTYGQAGEAWLTQLPDITAACEARFNIRIGDSLPELSYNYLAHARLGRRKPFIAKFSVDDDEFDHAVRALLRMQCDHMVEWIAYEPKMKVLLLEELIPGASLVSLEDDVAATDIIIDILLRIIRPARKEHQYPTTEQWFERLDRPIRLPQVFSQALITTARDIAARLHQSTKQVALLHGDLHHGNILSSDRHPWVAIDPKGVVGPVAYECGAALRNPLHIANDINIKKTLSRRIDQFSARLGIDKGVIAGWGFAQAVLAAVWSLDMKSEEWRSFLACSEILYMILQSYS